MECKFKKDLILYYSNNKQQFIDLLSNELKRCDYVTRHANEDADTLIVSLQLLNLLSISLLLFGDDTDFLVL